MVVHRSYMVHGWGLRSGERGGPPRMGDSRPRSISRFNSVSTKNNSRTPPLRQRMSKAANRGWVRMRTAQCQGGDLSALRLVAEWVTRWHSPKGGATSGLAATKFKIVVQVDGRMKRKSHWGVMIFLNLNASGIIHCRVVVVIQSIFKYRGPKYYAEALPDFSVGA